MPRGRPALPITDKERHQRRLDRQRRAWQQRLEERRAHLIQDHVEAVLTSEPHEYPLPPTGPSGLVVDELDSEVRVPLPMATDETAQAFAQLQLDTGDLQPMPRPSKHSLNSERLSIELLEEGEPDRNKDQDFLLTISADSMSRTNMIRQWTQSLHDADHPSPGPIQSSTSQLMRESVPVPRTLSPLQRSLSAGLAVSPGGNRPGPRLFPSRTDHPAARATPGEISRGPD